MYILWEAAKKMEGKVLQTQTKCGKLYTKDGFLLCPRCGRRTDQKLLPDTTAARLPVYCKKCKQISVVDIDPKCLCHRA